MAGWRPALPCCLLCHCLAGSSGRTTLWNRPIPKTVEARAIAKKIVEGKGHYLLQILCQEIQMRLASPTCPRHARTIVPPHTQRLNRPHLYRTLGHHFPMGGAGVSCPWMCIPAFVVMAGVSPVTSAWDAQPPTASRPAAKSSAPTALADRLGCTHVKGSYNFTKGDFLNEGADQVLRAGFRTIKLYLHDPRGSYPFNSNWPKSFKSLVHMAQHPLYREVFRKPFGTCILTTFSIGKDAGDRWRGGDDAYDYAEDVQQFHDLAVHLMRAYKGTGKTFILQNWEGDWYVGHHPDLKNDPSDQAIKSMIRWLNARQEGVDQARREVVSDVKVYHAAEVNLVRIAMEGRKTVTNDVLPKTHCDLYSYSAYDTIGLASEDVPKGREIFRKALDYLAAKAPDSAAYGDKNVYVGEFGWPEVRNEKQDPHASTEKCLNVLRMTVETSLDWGCPYVVYWQLYDNEPRVKDRRPANDEVRGFYLVKPDGTHAAAYDYFSQLLGAPNPSKH